MPALSSRALRACAVASVLLVALYGAAGCPKAGTDPAATTATAAPSPPWWMSLKDGKLHRGLDEAPIGLYVAGDMEDDRFSPGGDVEGDGPIGAAGEEGWLDLRTGAFVKRGEPEPPPPVVDGHRTPAGFSPTSRRVRY
jgi:hypothetical protein